MCRDTKAALNLLKKGMSILGMDWPNSTQGQGESVEKSKKHGEKTTSIIDGKPDLVSGFV
jgi:putative transposase